MIERTSIEKSAKPPIEVERKWRVAMTRLDELGPLDRYDYSPVRQGYLVIGVDGSEMRVRDSNGIYTATVKTRGNIVRSEWEVEITKEQFDGLWGASEGRRVEKTRFNIPHGEYIVELDVYEGALAGLVTAEIEFNDERTALAFVSPEWLGKDVTDDQRYKNQNLAVGRDVL